LTPRIEISADYTDYADFFCWFSPRNRRFSKLFTT
jgi:hypothetical protein